MKNSNHFRAPNGRPRYCKFWRMVLLLALFAFSSDVQLRAQGACSGIEFSFDPYEPCKYRAEYTNTSECFTEIRYLLESGTFASWVVNSGAGFTVDVISPSELWVHHNQGFIPLGNQTPLLFTLPYDLNTNILVAYNDACAMVGCDIFGGFPVSSCPDPQDASIIGVKYRECGNLPYNNQQPLSGWLIQVINEAGDIVREDVTAADGSYAAYDLPKGNYIVKEVAKPGWMPKVPADGRYEVILEASEQLVRNFGNCQVSGILSGVVYETCDSVPYADQPGLSGWVVQAIDAAGNVVKQDTADSSGNYLMDLPVGIYWVKVVMQSGGEPNFPASEGVVVDLNLTSQAVQNFGICVTCCNTIVPFIFQTANINSNACCYALFYQSTASTCLGAITISVGGSGLDPTSIIPIPGWTVSNITASSFKITPPGNTFPVGTLSPVSFCVNGSGLHSITSVVQFTSGQVQEFCSKQFLFNCGDNFTGSCACPSGSTPDAQNLIVNGDFGFNGGFTTGHVFNPNSTILEGQYTITSLASLANAGFQPCHDHTTGSGNMMVVNGSTLSNKLVWRQTVPVTPNTNYSFQAWVASMTNSSTAIMALSINGPAYGNPFVLSSSNCNWEALCEIWNSGSNTTATISLYNLNTAAQSNDFAIDDISFRKCTASAPCGVSITASPTPFCGSGTLTAIPTGNGPFSYQWSHGQNTQTINVQGLPCGSVCSVTVTCSDGTMSSASYTVTDNVPPVAICNPGVGVDLGTACTFQVTPAFVDGGSSDNCQIQSMTVTPSTLNACTTTTVTLTVTDWCNNTSTCTMGIQTTEGVAPSLSCPPNSIVIGTLAPNGTCIYPFNPALPVAIDNCDPSVTVTHNGPSVLQQGPNTITWTATDDCGNQVTCSQVITVQCDCDCDGNLVTNGGFENGAAGLPNGLNQIGQCAGWTAATNSPAANNIGDWYSNSNPAFPGYFLGPNQTELQAHCGQKYAGFFLNTCEGITTQLSQTIQQGCSYEVSFWWTPAGTPTTPFSFLAVMSGGNCTMYHPTGTCGHQCNGDQHIVVNATSANQAGTWYKHTFTVNTAYPNVQYMTFTANQGTPNVVNYIFVDDICVKKIADPCEVEASIECYPQSPTSYTAQATLGCGSVVTQVDWYFDGNGPISSTNLNSVLYPFNTVGWHTVCLVVSASSDGGHTICKDSICKEVFVDHAPPTKCDSVAVAWQPYKGPNPPCCYTLQIDNLAPQCFRAIEVVLSSGTFANAVFSSGWTPIGNLNSNQIFIAPSNGSFLPTGLFSPLFLCNPGGTPAYTVQVNVYYGTLANPEKCEAMFDVPGCPNPPVDSCCLDYDLFCQNVMNAVTVTVDNNNCKATFSIGGLPDCDYVEWVQWGDGSQSGGPFLQGSMPMHTYTQSGTYVIQYLAIELSPHTGLICFEKVLTTTIVVECADCNCQQTGFGFTHDGVFTPVSCNNPAQNPTYGCPVSDVTLTGALGCVQPDGTPCTQSLITWTLYGPNGFINTGTLTGPAVNLSFPAASIGAPGAYSVTLQTLCPGQTDSCMCTLYWLQAPCDTCTCGSFSHLFARPSVGAQSIALMCGGTYNFPCPAPGQSIPITGKFECVGNACTANTVIGWTLIDPAGNPTNGSIIAGPQFYLPIQPLQYAQPGTYTLILKGNCGGTDCPPCVIKFTVDCPNPCPCDVLQFQKDVAKGFAVSQSIVSCKACFAPLALNDCDMVEWKVNGGATVGMTNGNKTFCFNFPGAGTYTVTMIVTRKKSDGSLCEVFVFSRTVVLNCLIKAACEDSVFPNSSFSEGAVAGGLNGTGASTGWYGPCGDPVVEEGVVGSLDGWSVNLSGNLDSADVLASLNPVCLEKSSGNLLIRTRLAHHGDPHENINGKHIKARLYQTSGFEMEECDEASCYDLATLDLGLLDSNWVDITIPYDLSDWAAADTACGGVKARLALFVTTPLGSDQGTQPETRVGIEVDNLCVEGGLVSVKELYASLLRIFPNPNAGTFQVELPESAATGTMFRITDLTGRLVQEQATVAGSKQQTVLAGMLPDGLYFLQVLLEGQVMAVEKFVKQ